MIRNNAKGRRTEMWDASGHTIWQYDARGRVSQEDRYVDGKFYTTSYQYDAIDRVTLTVYPDGEQVNSTYNNQLLLNTMIGANDYIKATTGYTALGQPTAINYGNNDVVSMAYDTLTSRLTSITAPSVGLSYLYFPNGYLSRITDGTATDFTYDPLDRLKTAGGECSASYSYDQIGNITSKTEGGTSHSYDYANSGHKHAPRPVDGNAQTYDANGNLTGRSGLSLKYDAENRLVKVSSDSGGAVYVARLAYDGDGRRAKRVDNYGTILYAGPHYERNVGTGADTTEVITKFYYAQMGAMKRLIAFKNGSTLYYIVPDHLGRTLRGRYRGERDR